MADDSHDYKLGQLTAALDALEGSVAKLDATMARLDRRVDELRLWKSQVVGVAAVVSAFISFAAAIVPKLMGRTH